MFKGGEKLPTHENMWWSKAKKVKVRIEAAVLFLSCSLNLNHWIRQNTCHCKGTQTSMSEKSTDQAAVVEPTISSPDISLHTQSESSPKSTSLNESSNPIHLTAPREKWVYVFLFCYINVMNTRHQEVSHLPTQWSFRGQSLYRTTVRSPFVFESWCKP